MATATCVIRQTPASHYYFTVLTSAEEVTFTSESYASREQALLGIEAFKVNACFNNRYERLCSPRAELYFALRGSKNQILGTSAMYFSDQAREKAILAMKRYGPRLQLRDDGERAEP